MHKKLFTSSNPAIFEISAKLWNSPSFKLLSGTSSLRHLLCFCFAPWTPHNALCLKIPPHRRKSPLHHLKSQPICFEASQTEWRDPFDLFLKYWVPLVWIKLKKVQRAQAERKVTYKQRKNNIHLISYQFNILSLFFTLTNEKIKLYLHIYQQLVHVCVKNVLLNIPTKNYRISMLTPLVKFSN